MRQAEITEAVERTATLVDEHYVFPDLAGRLATLLTDNLAAGRYATAPTPAPSVSWSPPTSSPSTATCTSA